MRAGLILIPFALLAACSDKPEVKCAARQYANSRPTLGMENSPSISRYYSLAADYVLRDLPASDKERAKKLGEKNEALTYSCGKLISPEIEQKLTDQSVGFDQ